MVVKIPRTLPDDAIAAMAGVGIPGVLIVACWGGSTFASATILIEFLSAALAVPDVEATVVSCAVTVAFLVASCGRLFVPGLIRDASNMVCTGIVGAWLAAALWHGLHRSDLSVVVACSTVLYTAVSNWAMLKLFDQHRKPGVTAHNLYRFYNSTGTLLYIGITSDVRARFRQHTESKSWWPQVTVREITHFRTRADLVAAERTAIIRERPRFNIQHNGVRR